jgi:dethiobiotin synthetase
MRKGFFVTATDTSVGKTVVSAAVIRALNFLGYRTAAMKPLETGCPKDGKLLMPSDGLFLKKIAKMDEPVSLITPSVYEASLSPFAAAELEGREPDLPGIFRAFDSIMRKYDAVVVEGVGGLYVPVVENYFVSDLAREMALPLIIVARPGLGTINHTLLTIHYAFSKGLDMAGIILNYSSPPGDTLAEETNPKTLQSLTEVPVIGTFPYLSVMEEETLDKAVVKSLDLGMLRKALEKT